MVVVVGFLRCVPVFRYEHLLLLLMGVLVGGGRGDNGTAGVAWVGIVMLVVSFVDAIKRVHGLHPLIILSWGYDAVSAGSGFKRLLVERSWTWNEPLIRERRGIVVVLAASCAHARCRCHQR